MPTVKKRLGMRAVYSAVVSEYLLTGEQPKEEDSWWEIFALTCEKETVRSAWESLRDELLPAWVEEHPGTRPWGWWKHDAPKAKVPGIPEWHLPEMVEPRKQIGGTGAPPWEEYPAILPYYTLGLPDSLEGIDPEDLPRFESEASYLDRHGLLSAAERKALPPYAYEPEMLR